MHCKRESLGAKNTLEEEVNKSLSIQKKLQRMLGSVKKGKGALV